MGGCGRQDGATARRRVGAVEARGPGGGAEPLDQGKISRSRYADSMRCSAIA